MSLKTFLRVGSFYQAPAKHLTDDMEMTSIVSNADPQDPVVDPPGGGGTTLYTGDGTLAGDRIVDLDGKSLEASQGGNRFLFISPTAGSEQSELKAYNSTGGTNIARVSFNTTNVDAISLFISRFNGGAKQAFIEALADATTATLTSTADTHTFNGKIVNTTLVADDFANDAAAAIGGIAVGGLYHTGGTVKVRLV